MACSCNEITTLSYKKWSEVSWLVLLQPGLQLLWQDGQELLQHWQLQDLLLGATDSKAPRAGSEPSRAQVTPGSQTAWSAGGKCLGCSSFSRGGWSPDYRPLLPSSLPERCQALLKFVEGVLMTLNFADIWMRNSSGLPVFNFQGGKALLIDTS